MKEVPVQIFVFGDPNNNFLDSGFNTENRLLWSGYQTKIIDSPISCTLTSLIKRPMKERSLDTAGGSEIFCYTSQLTDKKKQQKLS